MRNTRQKNPHSVRTTRQKNPHSVRTSDQALNKLGKKSVWLSMKTKQHVDLRQWFVHVRKNPHFYLFYFLFSSHKLIIKVVVNVFRNSNCNTYTIEDILYVDSSSFLLRRKKEFLSSFFFFFLSFFFLLPCVAYLLLYTLKAS